MSLFRIKYRILLKCIDNTREIAFIWYVYMIGWFTAVSCLNSLNPQKSKSIFNLVFFWNFWQRLILSIINPFQSVECVFFTNFDFKLILKYFLLPHTHNKCTQYLAFIFHYSIPHKWFQIDINTLNWHKHTKCVLHQYNFRIKI